MELKLIHSFEETVPQNHLSHDPLMDLLNEFSHIEESWQEPELEEMIAYQVLSLEDSLETMTNDLGDKLSQVKSDLTKLKFYLQECQDFVQIQ
jgi:hypothetical protein